MKEQNEKQAIEEMANIAHEAIEKYNRLPCRHSHCEFKDKPILCDECESVRALYNAGYRKQSEWISVDERLPDVRRKVLLYSPTDGINIGHRLDEVGRFYVGKAYPDRPTHWMPLPEPPKMKGGAE